MNLIEAFSELEDFRRPQGRRYPLGPMLVIVIMGIACGHTAYREIARFAKANADRLRELFRLERPEMPSHVTIRTLIQGADFSQLLVIFENWSVRHAEVGAGDWLSADGKAIASTVSDHDKSYQDFVSMISVFSQKYGQVAGSDIFSNKKDSEIPTFENLVRLLGLEDVVFTMDALHCQKDTLNTIVGTDNDYVVKVKANQPTLLNSLIRNSETSEPLDIFETSEINRGRLETRETSVFGLPPDLPEGWPGVSRVICVRRLFEKSGDIHSTTSFYISSLESDSAELFAQGIRGHWHVENRLHYVKDVIMNEDGSGIRNQNAAANMSLFRNIVINVLRGNGFDSVKAAVPFMAANLPKLYDLLRT